MTPATGRYYGYFVLPVPKQRLIELDAKRCPPRSQNTVRACVSKVREICVGTAMDGLKVRRTIGTTRTTGATAEEGGEVRDSNGILIV